MIKESGIYCIQSKIIPSRIYIGSSSNLKDRFYRHLLSLKDKKHYNAKLNNHAKKYGVDDLEFFVVLNCKREDLLKNEQLYIDILNPYFNLRPIANSNKGTSASKDTREKMSISAKKLWETEKRKQQGSAFLKEMWKDELYRDKRSESSKKMWDDDAKREQRSEMSKQMWSDESYVEKMRIQKENWWKVPENRERISKKIKGRIISEDTKKKISETLSGRKKSYEEKLKLRFSKKSIGKSKFKGVSFCKANTNLKWKCFCYINNKYSHLYSFNTEVEAAIAREHFILLNDLCDTNQLNYISSSGE